MTGTGRRSSKPARGRLAPGVKETGDFFHIEVRPAREFVRFRMQDVGKRGGVERLAGQRADGSWDTQKWLIERSHAHIAKGELVADSAAADKVLASLGSVPIRVEGNRFKARPRRAVRKSGIAAKRRTSR
jgi:hypothetical protein